MYVKDSRSKVVINTDDSHYKSILSARSASEKNRLLGQEINSLREELCDIRDLLQKVIAK